jgi:hypothetical protein
MVHIYERSLIACHSYYTLGYLTLGIDYFFGDPIGPYFGKPDFDIGAWVGSKYGPAHEAAPRWLKAVKEKYGTLSLVS